jgi:hypothetical protein
MSDESQSVLPGDASADMLRRAACRTLEDVLNLMWVVSPDRRRLILAMRDALASYEGVGIAEVISRYFNPYGDAKATAPGTLSGDVKMVHVVPGSNELVVCPGDGCVIVSAGIPLSIDGADATTVGELAEWLTENACSVSMTVGEESRATEAEFTARKP